MIESRTDSGKNLTIFTGTGIVETSDIIEAVQSFYDGKPTMNVIWHLLDADVSGIQADDISRLAQFVKELAHSRPNGRTALVAAWDVTYGLSRMYQAWADLSKQTTNVNVFRSMDEAEAWISQST